MYNGSIYRKYRDDNVPYSLGELILLRCCDGFSDSEDRYPKYFYYQYNLDISACMQKFRRDELIDDMPVGDMLKNYKIPELKQALQSKQLSVSGTKYVLIQRLLKNISEEELRQLFTEHYVVITEKAKKILSENLSEFEYDNRCNSSYIVDDFDKFMVSIKDDHFIDIVTEQLKKNKYTENDIDATKEFYCNYSNLSNEIKIIIVLKFLDGARTETIQKSLLYYLGENVSISDIGYSVRWIQSYSELFRLKKTNLKYTYTIENMKDNSVCDFCAAFIGKKFDISSAVIGVNYPPFKNCKNDYCRCFVSHDINL